MPLSCVLGWTMVPLTAIDSRIGLLPDSFTVFLVLSGVVAAGWLDPRWPVDNLLGAAAGFSAFAALGWGYEQIRGRPGLGLGDAKLLAGLGAWVSWTGLPTVVFLAAILGLGFIFLRSFQGEPIKAADSLPFGPFLAAGGWLVWLYGPLAIS